MSSSEIIDLLGRHKAVLKERFDVSRIALFGSVVRNTATDISDVDVLVQFNGPATSNRFFGVQFYLEDLFGRPVDLVTSKALRPELKPYIDKEIVYV